MNKNVAVFLQIVVVFFGTGVLVWMLWEPHLEGVNAHATVFEIYFQDPFLAYAYMASIPFFVGLFQIFKILGYAGQDEIISRAAVKALRTIRYCAILCMGLIAGGVIFLLSMDTTDDRPPILAMGTLAILAAIVIATAALKFEKSLRHAVDMKSENALTV